MTPISTSAFAEESRFQVHRSKLEFLDSRSSTTRHDRYPQIAPIRGNVLNQGVGEVGGPRVSKIPTRIVAGVPIQCFFWRGNTRQRPRSVSMWHKPYDTLQPPDRIVIS